ncbi:6882_t:CDS:1, partial [Racocetra fulgida]
KFKCTQKIPEKQRKELEDEFQKTGEMPFCNLCKNKHIRCKNFSCSNCCEKFKCNSPGKCDYCKKLGIECEYTFPRTQEEFEKYSIPRTQEEFEKYSIPRTQEEFEKYSIPRTQEEFEKYPRLVYIIHQFEITEGGRVYNQAHLIFNIKMTITSVKKLFKDDEIFFSKESAKDDSSSNQEYAKKIYNRCKLHHNEHCDDKCCLSRTLARCKGSPEIVGPFEFGKWKCLEGSNKNKECEKIIEMKLDDMKRVNNIITYSIPFNQVIDKSAELLPRGWINSLKTLKNLEEEKSKNKTKHIPEKKHYPKNFFFYGDSGPGKSTLMEKLAVALSKGRPHCIKAKDREYIDEYQNQVCIIKDELTHDTFNFEDLLSCCEKDNLAIKQRNKMPIGIVSKFHLFTAQDSFDNIFCFEKCKDGVKSKDEPVKSKEKRIAIFRRFTKARAYTHGYIIKLEGRYERDGRVKFIIESDELNNPGDLNEFIHGNFDIKFVEGITLEEAKKYVYDDEIDDLYKDEDEEVYLKIKVDMSHILGGVICDVNDKENSFWVYNKNWQGDLPSNFIYPENLNKINKKLREKIQSSENLNNIDKKLREKIQYDESLEFDHNENLREEGNYEENSFRENAPEGNCMEENNLDNNFIDEEPRQIQNNHEESNKKHLFEDEESDIDEDDRH